MEDGLDMLISRLRDQEGKPFWQKLEAITQRKEFHLIENGIFSTLGPEDPDMERLLDAARKAVAFGYTVYLLPNPKGIKSADYIFKRRSSYRLYELKTVLGNSSAGTRLQSSIGQADRVVLNVTSNYNLRRLAEDINRYYEASDEVKEVILFYHHRKITVMRSDCGNALWKLLMKRK